MAFWGLWECWHLLSSCQIEFGCFELLNAGLHRNLVDACVDAGFWSKLCRIPSAWIPVEALVVSLLIAFLKLPQKLSGAFRELSLGGLLQDRGILGVPMNKPSLPRGEV